MKRASLLSILALLVAAGWAGPAIAQEIPADSTFSIQLFEPAPGPDNFLTVEGTRIGSDFSITAGALFHYQYRPFVLYDCEPGTGGPGEPACALVDDPRAVVVEHQIAGDLMFSIAFLKLFTAGLAVPLTLYQTGNELDVATGLPTGSDLPSAFAVGDMRLHLKFRLFPFMEGDQEGFGLAFSPVVSFPIGSQFDSNMEGATGSFLGDGNVTFTARVSADYFAPPFHAAAQIGYHWREDSQIYSTTMGQELVFGAAFAWWALPDLAVLVEMFGRNGFTNQIDQTPLEADAAVRYRLGPIVLTAGAGAGILKAVGAPVARAFLGVLFQPFEEALTAEQAADRDQDGILNEDDACADEAEDVDQFHDDDGCPEPDNDEDGVLDAFDACGEAKEDMDGFEDADGCPDLDHDNDGVDIPTDQCPEEGEDFDGFRDDDGCAEADNDEDGMPDNMDICPDEAEDIDDFQDEDGCPDLDNDVDGVGDAADRCPSQPETLNGVNDTDGCPDAGTTLVVVTESRIEIRQQVNFETDSDEIVGRTSFQVLDVVAAVLIGNPSLNVEIQGHTDSQGDYDRNVELSQRRADAVRVYLINAGVDAGHLTARGYGPDVPLSDNRTRTGRAANRRVEFHIQGSGGGSAPAAGPEMEVPAPSEEAPPAEGGDEMSFE